MSKDTIILLSDRDKVRERPGMYIGDSGKLGLATIVREVIDNAIDEYVNYPDPTLPVTITLHQDGSISVRDHGRGISPYQSKKYPGEIEERLAFTRLGAGGKMRANRSENGYKNAGGLNGVGAAAANFMSSYFDVTIYKPEGIYHDRYENGGIPVVELTKSGNLPKTKNATGETGTLIRFSPDPTVMRETTISASHLKRLLYDQQFLNQGLRLQFINERDDEQLEFYAEGGLLDLVHVLGEQDGQNDIQGKAFLLNHFETTTVGDEEVDMSATIGMAISKKEHADILAFTNGIRNSLGGTHVSGFYNGMTRLLSHYFDVFKQEYTARYKTQLELIQKVFKESDVTKLIKTNTLQNKIYAVIDFKHSNPELQPQTKDRLVSAEARTMLSEMVYQQGMLYFDKQITVVHQLLDYIIKLLYDKAKNDDDTTTINKNDSRLLVSTKLSAVRPGNEDKAELFLVEGDSAGGTIKQYRNAKFQGVLPLRGKLINVQNITTKEALDNSEVSTFIAAIGTGFGRNFDINALKYNKIIIATDQDVDGKHIRILILTMLWRFVPDLVRNGHVYILETPLYINTLKGNKEYYTYSDFEQQEYLNEHKVVSIKRNKGLGELDIPQVKKHVLDENNRRLLQIQVEDDEELDRVIEQLMGKESAPRRNVLLGSSE